MVRNLIVDLLKTHPGQTSEHFNGVFKSLLSKELANASALKASKAAVIALGWTSLIAKHACLSENETNDTIKNEFPKLMEYQSLFYQMTLLSGKYKLIEAADKIMFELWSENKFLIEKYFKKFLDMEPSSNVIVFLMLMIRYKARNYDTSDEENNADENDSWLKVYKSKLIEHFIKGLVTVKVKPNYNWISACQILLKSLEKDEFEKHLLPPLQRAMLRNPEIILQGVGAIVQELELDMSDHAMNLGKPLMQNLYSKDDAARNESVESLKQLAIKCKKPKSIEELLKAIFAILNGSDGKITVAEYRMNILQVL